MKDGLNKYKMSHHSNTTYKCVKRNEWCPLNYESKHIWMLFCRQLQLVSSYCTRVKLIAFNANIRLQRMQSSACCCPSMVYKCAVRSVICDVFTYLRPNISGCSKYMLQKNKAFAIYQLHEIVSINHRLKNVIWFCENQRTNSLHVTHLRNRFQTASVTARTIPGLRRICPRTVRNRLCEHHIRPPSVLRTHASAAMPSC